MPSVAEAPVPWERAEQQVTGRQREPGLLATFADLVGELPWLWSADRTLVVGQHTVA